MKTSSLTISYMLGKILSSPKRPNAEGNSNGITVENSTITVDWTRAALGNTLNGYLHSLVKHHGYTLFEITEEEPVKKEKKYVSVNPVKTGKDITLKTKGVTVEKNGIVKNFPNNKGKL